VLRLALCLLVLVLLPGASAADAATWLRPVDGPLLRPFALGRDTYARGWHRGVDLAAARGSPVRSACSGRVSFAGSVPRGGRTVSVRCGAIVASYQQLGALAVREGRDVVRGARLGAVGASSDPRQPRPHLHLGARSLATGRYLDPLGLLRAGPPAMPLVPPVTRAPPRAAPLGPAPRPPRIHPVPAARAPRTVPRVAPGSPRDVADPGVRSPGRAAVPRVGLPGGVAVPGVGLPGGVAVPRVGLPGGVAVPSVGSPRAAPAPGVPWPVWLGLACVGLGLPFGGFVRVRRRRHATSRVAQTA
jgi:hypothetical protein